MRFRPANNSLINSRSTPPTPPAAIVKQPCNTQMSEIFYHLLERLLTGPSITAGYGWPDRTANAVLLQWRSGFKSLAFRLCLDGETEIIPRF